ncbi:MAG TPA: class I SAM-dependent methyltransferase [Candidatus Acidoferrum sp.]|nr:class I SAM-dependent methyltransferase [Candidatus Acidoferrum sp.]
MPDCLDLFSSFFLFLWAILLDFSVSDDPKSRAASTYNAAADFFDAPPLAFWDRIGRRSVEKAALRAGAHVLDVCCGAGASALPAAEAVGGNGRVVGVDLAENLLHLARQKTQHRGLANTEFRHADVESLDPAAESFDAVICVFGIFFLPDMDMPAAVRHLWKLLRPGGNLVITTWGPRVLEPGNSIFWDAVRAERPDLYKSFNPWERINEPRGLSGMLLEAGVTADEVHAESDHQPLESPEDFWTIVLGSGYRGTIEQLDPAARERVRRAVLHGLSELKPRSVETNAVYAIARKPTIPLAS